MQTIAPTLERPALIVVDVQCGFDDEDFWGPRNNAACEGNIALLLEHWHQRSWPIVVVLHDSDDPRSPLAPGGPGHELKDVVTGSPDLVVHKRVNSSFYGTPDLDAWLRGEDIAEVVICGITTNHCCETTARMAGNLGYATYFAIDATHTFDRMGPDGALVPADTLANVTATNLHGEFATVLTTQDLLRT